MPKSAKFTAYPHMEHHHLKEQLIMDVASPQPKAKFLKRRESIAVQRSISDVVVTFERLKSILALPAHERTDSQINTLMMFSMQMKFFAELRETVGEYAHHQCCKHLEYQACPPGMVRNK